MSFGQKRCGREIALEIAARDPETGREIGVRADAAVELQGGRDLDQSAPISRTAPPKVLQSRDRGHETIVEIFASSASQPAGIIWHPNAQRHGADRRAAPPDRRPTIVRSGFARSTAWPNTSVSTW